ncbi:amidohydrolase family protein [Nocardia brasiliensis]|uniref:amidohydrolase family protein n=1 Tax=Nocardia brasiliensis TaxID=37326 RepID=UPI002B4B77CB|nr:amidohydrolase family protein [Nocardia brasiliensis]
MVDLGGLRSGAAVGAVECRREAAMTSEGQLLRGGIVLTMDDEIGDFDKADVLIDNGEIVAVGRDLHSAAKVVDCAGKIVIPGFVNSHHHMFQTALRSFWSDALEIDYFLQSRTGEDALFHQYTPEDVYWGEYGGALECLAAGTTTVVDTSQCSYTPEHTDAALDAIRRAGIRCMFSFSPALGDHEPAETYAHPDDIHRLRGTYDSSGGAGLVRLALGYHVDEDLFQLAKDLELPVFAHVNDVSWGRVLEQFEAEGLLGPWITYIHCLGLEDGAWKAIRRSGGRVSVSVSAELSLGMGVPALQAAVDHQVPVSLGTDTVGIAPTDFFSQMRAAFLLQRHTAMDAARRGRPETVAPLSTRDILRIATVGGARAAQLDHLVGTLTPGKRADIAILNARTLNASPMNHAAGAIVQLMDTGNVDTVLVDGRIVKQGGRMVYADIDDVLSHLDRSAAGLLQRAGRDGILLTGCRSL